MQLVQVHDAYRIHMHTGAHGTNCTFARESRTEPTLHAQDMRGVLACRRSSKKAVFMPTRVTFVDRLGAEEVNSDIDMPNAYTREFPHTHDTQQPRQEGDDQGGLTAEMFSLFFREAFCPSSRLFETAGDGDAAAHLPRADAPAGALRAAGRVMLKALVDDHPIGAGLAPFVLDFLVGAHERRVFCSAEAALVQLRHFDARLAACWSSLLKIQAGAGETTGASLGLAGLSFGSFDPDHPAAAEQLTSRNVRDAVLAGCRHRLLGCREASLGALREGFTQHHDLQLQLAPLSHAELCQMCQGRPSLSTTELLGCFDWSQTSSFGASAHISNDLTCWNL